MSLFKSLKGTLKSVQGDLSDSLKALSVSPDKPSTPESFHYSASQVNYDAGADILHRDELVWKDLYQFTEETARKAQDVDIEIGNLYIFCDKQSETLVRFHDECSRLPALITQLQEITDSLAMLEEEYDKVEAALVQLENVCEEQDFQRNIASHHKQLAVYKMKKEHELQKYKVHLAKEHAKKVEQANKKREHLLHEKQVAFGEQFAQDVEYFKKHGKPGRLPTTPESEKKLDLAEIVVDEDPEALNAFLATEGDTTETETKEISDDEEDTEGPSVDIIPEITIPVETGEPVASMSDEKSDNYSSHDKLIEKGSSVKNNLQDASEKEDTSSEMGSGMNADGNAISSDGNDVKSTSKEQKEQCNEQSETAHTAQNPVGSSENKTKDA